MIAELIMAPYEGNELRVHGLHGKPTRVYYQLTKAQVRDALMKALAAGDEAVRPEDLATADGGTVRSGLLQHLFGADELSTARVYTEDELDKSIEAALTKSAEELDRMAGRYTVNCGVCGWERKSPAWETAGAMAEQHRKLGHRVTVTVEPD